MGAYLASYMHQQLRNHERAPLLDGPQLPRYVEPSEESLPAYNALPERPGATFTPHPDEPILENAPDLARKIMQRRRRVFWNDPVWPSALREMGALIGGLTGLSPLLAACALEDLPKVGLVAGLLSPVAGALLGQLGGMYLDRQRRMPVGPSLLLEQGIAHASCDARFVCETLVARGAMRRGGHREPLHDLLDLAAAPEYPALSPQQNRRLRYVLWVAAHSDQIPRGLWEKLEAARDEDEINHVKALICAEFARLKQLAAGAQALQGTVMEWPQAGDAERSAD